MADPHIGPLPEGTKHCKVCQEPINKHAWRCIHCSADQGRWRNRIGFFTGTILSLLLGLISVGTVFIPVLRDWWTRKDSNIFFSFQAANADVISILATNTGARPGTVGTGIIFFSLSSKFPEPNPMVHLKNSRENYVPAVILEPGSSMLISYEIVEEDLPIKRSDLNKMYCDLEIYSTSFAGVTSSIPVEVFVFDVYGGVIKQSCQGYEDTLNKRLPPA